MDNSKALKKRVMYFIEQQPGYNSTTAEEISITRDTAHWSILYGESIEAGIVGMGATEDEAFDDFINKWYSFKGFEWIRKSKIVSKL